MLFAIYENQKVRATKDGPRKAICPCCNSDVQAKTGTINIHHWAHANLSDCPMNSNDMTQWHIDQQNQFHDYELEIRDPKWPNNVADVCILNPTPDLDYLVVEVQHSPISYETIYDRHAAYKNLIWIIDMDNRKRLPRTFEYVDSKNKIYYFNGLYVHHQLGIKPEQETLREFVIRCFTCNTDFTDGLQETVKHYHNEIYKKTLAKTIAFKKEADKLKKLLNYILYRTISLKPKEDQAKYIKVGITETITNAIAEAYPNKDDLIIEFYEQLIKIKEEYLSDDYNDYVIDEEYNYNLQLQPFIKIENAFYETRWHTYSKHCNLGRVILLDIINDFNLKVSYNDKASVKEKGAKWDPDNKTWYIPTKLHLLSDLLVLFDYIDPDNIDIATNRR